MDGDKNKETENKDIKIILEAEKGSQMCIRDRYTMQYKYK